jgi:hypothetical protein
MYDASIATTADMTALKGHTSRLCFPSLEDGFRYRDSVKSSTTVTPGADRRCGFLVLDSFLGFAEVAIIHFALAAVGAGRDWVDHFDFVAAHVDFGSEF